MPLVRFNLVSNNPPSLFPSHITVVSIINHFYWTFRHSLLRVRFLWLIPNDVYYFHFILSNNIVWFSLLFIQMPFFYCCICLPFWSSLLSLCFISPRCKWGVLISSLFLFSALSLHCVACWFPAAPKIVSDSLVVAYSGIKRTIMNLSFHPILPLLPTDIIRASSLTPRSHFWIANLHIPAEK